MSTQRHATSPDDLPDSETRAGLTGLAFLRNVVAGELPQAPIARLMNIRLVSVSEGEALFEGRPEFDHVNPMGGVHGGWYGTLLDSVLGCAVMTTLPKGRAYTTLEYKVNLVRAIRTGTKVRARGIVSHAGRTTAVATAEIRGADDDRRYATGNKTCLIMAAN